MRPNSNAALITLTAAPLLKNLHWAALAWIACFELAWGLVRLVSLL